VETKYLSPTRTQTTLLFFMCVLFYSSCVCRYAYANVYFKTTIIKQTIQIILLAGMPSSRAIFRFPQYCAFTCVRFGCTRHARCVDTKPKKKSRNTGRASDTVKAESSGEDPRATGSLDTPFFRNFLISDIFFLL